MVIDHRDIFDTLVSTEKVEIRFKCDSLLMRLAGKVMGQTFVEQVTTTIGGTVYFPNPEWVAQNYERSWMTLSHELVHVEDYRRLGLAKPLFLVAYAFPQVLSLLALLGFAFQSWWFLGCLLFLAPMPAPWRKRAEMRGYGMTMAVHYWRHGTGIPQGLRAFVTQQFSGPLYYFMWWPFSVEGEVGRWVKMILCSELQDQGPVFGRVQKLLAEKIKR